MRLRYSLRLVGLVVMMWGGAAGRDRLDAWVAQTVLPPVLSEVGVEVRDRDGGLLRAFSVENGRMRLALQLDQADPKFIEMLIAYEDKRFYTHAGVDLRAMLRAAGQAVWRGRIVSGGSTLTMQVARLLENSGTGRRSGKLRQIRVALALEQRLTKAEILTLYLHHAPYGGAVEGLRAASLVWFGREPLRLTDAQAALLVALPQSPEARRPDRHPQAAHAARARVLERLGIDGTEGLPPVPSTRHMIPQGAPHLAEGLRAAAPNVRVHDTTIDPVLQQQMLELARRAIAGQAKGVSAAIMVADHHTGEILALVGSPLYSAAGGALGFVDMTQAKRSPGSTLKPVVYGLAFDRGIAHPKTLINDAPVSFGGYAPQNFDGRFRGMLTVDEALTLSLNIPPVLLLNALGPARLMTALRHAGTTPELPFGRAGLAIGLGGVGTSLTELMQIYAGIAQGGQAPVLHSTKGEVTALSQRFLTRRSAWQVADILSRIAPPQGMAAQSGQIAYKTGTSYGHRDAWALGFDGQHVIGVWLGRPDGTPVPGAFGGDLAAPMVFEAFGRLSPRRVPFATAPADTLLVGNTSLPAPLRVFNGLSAAFALDPERPVVTFPPEGAVLQRTGFGVPLKLQAGALPLTVLVDGLPVMSRMRDREVLLPLETRGFTRISVVDAKGRSTSVEIWLD